MQKKVSLHKLENVFFLLVFLSGVAIFYGSSTVSDFLSSTTLTAKTYGMIVSGCLTVASGAKLLLNLAGAVKKEKQEMISFAEVPRMVICAVAMVVYCYGISNIGYFTCTTLFCILMLITLSGKRNPKVSQTARSVVKQTGCFVGRSREAVSGGRCVLSPPDCFVA